MDKSRLIELLNKHNTVELITMNGISVASIDYDYADDKCCDEQIRLVECSCTCGSINPDMLINPRSYGHTLELTIQVK